MQRWLAILALAGASLAMPHAHADAPPRTAAQPAASAAAGTPAMPATVSTTAPASAKATEAADPSRRKAENATGPGAETPGPTAPGVALKGPVPDARAPGAPYVESVDILKQNQAERTQTQPGNNAPTWRLVKSGVENYASLPYREAGILIQAKAQYPGQSVPTTAGEAWRRFRNGPMMVVGGWLLLVTIAALAGFYFTVGELKLKRPRTGRLIERFTSVERITHWTTAICFVILMVSGLTMLFGKFVLMPIMGHTLFGYLTYLLKTLHNFVGPLFTVALILTFIIFVKDNFPIAADFKWIFTLGGALSHGHASSGRFNAGEKLWFWGGVTVLGLTVAASGFVLDRIVPNLDYTRSLMQDANLIHLCAAVLMSAFALGHIYMGTIGMEGAYRAMRDGYVDDEWAIEHHDIWYDQIQKGEVPRVRTQEGAATVGTAPKTV
ncbi:formate dehydrogenase subunit gamma [Pseudoduganella sp. RAF19]|uniref:formate dehydrogenase subunit gamma n=1 Tax=Pseudoduganella sp. RAF19 TaxID=3233052 RepID=UPI003F996F82